MIEIEKQRLVIADGQLKQQVIELLQQNDLPVSDIDDGKILFALIRGGKIVGTAGLEVFDGCALVRSVSVEKASRGQGFGKFISQEIERISKEQVVACLYLLTTTAKDFFSKEGYQVITREEVPFAIRNTSEFLHVCPSSATVMKKDLS